MSSKTWALRGAIYTAVLWLAVMTADVLVTGSTLSLKRLIFIAQVEHHGYISGGLTRALAIGFFQWGLIGAVVGSTTGWILFHGRFLESASEAPQVVNEPPDKS